ncbi:hypothetical protein VPG91_06125 [Nitrospirillum amazonense]|uniref:hypothetical protein n=1 Tax=Nitrospirillum amazonense TaxID=28077 RepID=UPI002DD42A0C|nr:hypothetical protein [Nitrospirillum amazonense]MEC4590556.1 hypothetical protein [Nitrospirillum amazonense]
MEQNDHLRWAAQVDALSDRIVSIIKGLPDPDDVKLFAATSAAAALHTDAGGNVAPMKAFLQYVAVGLSFCPELVAELAPQLEQLRQAILSATTVPLEAGRLN